MKKDFIVKVGSYGSNTYVILDGEAAMYGITNELIGILKPGSHFSNVSIAGDDQKLNYNSKRIVHVIAKSLTIIGVIKRNDLD